MKHLIFYLFLCLIIACNNQSKTLSNVEEPQNSFVVDTFTAHQKEQNSQEYADSMEMIARMSADRVSDAIKEQQKNYTTEDWEREYILNAQYYITLEDVDIRYDENYQPVMSLIINNQTGLDLKSIKLIVDGSAEKAGTNDNVFTFKKTIPAKGKTNVSFKVRDNISINDVYFYSFITSDGKLGESKISVSDYSKKHHY